MLGFVVEGANRGSTSRGACGCTTMQAQEVRGVGSREQRLKRIRLHKWMSQSPWHVSSSDGFSLGSCRVGLWYRTFWLGMKVPQP